MTKPGTPKKNTSPVRQPVLLGLFAGTAIGAGFLFASVPNVEMMSLVIALSGAVLGPVLGPLCGALSASIFSLANPFGMAAPPLLLAQVLGQALMGLMGWSVGRRICRMKPDSPLWQAGLWAAAGGLLATLFYDALTTLVGVLVFPDLTLKLIFAQGIGFALVHMGVNSALFFLFFPYLVKRFGDAGQSPLIGRSTAPLIFVILIFFGVGSEAVAQPDANRISVPDSLQAAPADSLAMVPVAEEIPAGPNGWLRPLWNPFSATTLSWLDKRSNWIPMVDGGLGSMSMVLGEATTSPAPVFLRDGIPLGTGHRLTDDPWMVSNQGLAFVQQTFGRNGVGGTDGILNLSTDEKDLAKAVSYYRGVKGPHETYMRGISLLTPRTAWRLGFEFDESIDREGYNYTTLPDETFLSGNEFRGHSSVRRARTRLIRNLDEDHSLSIEYSNSRKTKNDLPVLGAEHQEIWSDAAAATATGRQGDWAYRSSLFWTSRTVEWGDRLLGADGISGRRKIETGREGVVIGLLHSARDTLYEAKPFLTDAGLKEEDFRSTGTGLRLVLSHWDVHDPGPSWQEISRSEVSGDGSAAHLVARSGLSLGSSQLNFGLSGNLHDQAGFRAGGFVSLQQAPQKPWWQVQLESGGRAPRSDELLTPLRHTVATGNLYLHPNADLKHEKTIRANVLLKGGLLGFDFALDASARRLREGITWVADPGEGSVGRWHNALDMNSSRLTASIQRQGRLLGWGRARLEGTWQDFDEKSAPAAFLPPKRYLRMELMWEQHLFQEDGILQLALLSTHRGQMNDPWDVTRNIILPSATSHDLIVGFRLVGAHLSLNFRNVTDQRVRLSSAALSPGREMDLRLHWVFLY